MVTMKWSEQQIKYIIQDMMDENPLACRALFSISEVKFTNKVPTMAVSLAEHPVLNINLTFCRQHLQSEEDVKAVLLHEFLHVLLLHTEKYKVGDTVNVTSTRDGRSLQSKVKIGRAHV